MFTGYLSCRKLSNFIFERELLEHIQFVNVNISYVIRFTFFHWEHYGLLRLAELVPDLEFGTSLVSAELVISSSSSSSSSLARPELEFEFELSSCLNSSSSLARAELESVLVLVLVLVSVLVSVPVPCRALARIRSCPFSLLRKRTALENALNMDLCTLFTYIYTYNRIRIRKDMSSFISHSMFVNSESLDEIA